MRSAKRSIRGILIAGVLALSAADAYAMGGGNGPDAGIGIIGNSYYDRGGDQGYTGPGYQAYTGHEYGHTYQNRNGGYGAHHGGYYRGY
jgi:hypothetical protein